MITDYVLDLNQFRFIKFIGKGGYGEVSLIEDKNTGEQLAAKIYQKDSISQDSQIEFYREIESFIKAKYPTILHFQGHNMHDFKNEPHPTIITEYMPNSSLSDMIDKMERVIAPKEWTETKKYINLIGIAFGMKFLHSINIVHRDLKPANVLDKNYYPKICDFGLSRLSNERITECQMKSPFGTPDYAAPEIKNGEKYTFKIDVFSFGVTALQIITGKLNQIKIEEIPGEKNQEFFKKCFSHNPSDRPTFFEICEYMMKKDFTDIFSLNFDEVYNFLDSFDEDAEVHYFHGLLLLENDDINEAMEY